VEEGGGVILMLCWYELSRRDNMLRVGGFSFTFAVDGNRVVSL
jgi:hypothetical protein